MANAQNPQDAIDIVAQHLGNTTETGEFELDSDKMKSMSRSQRMALLNGLNAGVQSVGKEVFAPISGVDVDLHNAHEKASKSPGNATTSQQFDRLQGLSKKAGISVKSMAASNNASWFSPSARIQTDNGPILRSDYASQDKQNDYVLRKSNLFSREYDLPKYVDENSQQFKQLTTALEKGNTSEVKKHLEAFNAEIRSF